MKVRAVTLFAAVVLLGSLGAPPVIASEASSAGPGQVGQWASPVHVGVVGIHAALLHTGKVLLWQYPGGAQGSAAVLYDPATGTVTDVTVPFPRDIFCAGLSILPDGRVFVAGGMNDNKPNVFAGTRNATIFDPATGLSIGVPVG